MTEKNEGFVWHAFHNTLLSYMHNYDCRVRTIKYTKPPNEIPMRLERFQFVKGKLPDVLNELQLYDYSPGWDAIQNLFKKHKDEIEKLHAEECKGCTWNGKEMVFPKHHIKRGLEWLKIAFGMKNWS